MTDLERARRSASDIARDRAAVRDIWPGLLALVALQGSLLVADPDGQSGGWRLTWSLSPLLPALWLVWAQLRSLRRADELQRRVQLEALAVGFGAMFLLGLTGGLLDAAGLGSPQQWLQITVIGGGATWPAALAARTWQLR